MSKFSYTITNKQGQLKKGLIEASSREEAASQIKSKDWYITSLEKEKGFFFSGGREKKMSSLERIIFTDHLASMFKSGTPLVDALETFKDDQSRKGTTIIEEMIKRVEQGKKLSEAMAAHPRVFSPLYLALIQSGELAGNLDEASAYIAQELKREHEFKEKVKSALFYPAIVLIAALAVVIFLILVVIPKITQFTKSFGGELPLATRVIAQIASTLKFLGPLLISLIIGAGIGSSFLLKNQQIRKKLDPYLLRLPLVGKLFKKYTLARFLRILGSCLKHGVPFSASLKIVEEVLGNFHYQESCRRIRQKVIRGVSLSKALSGEKTNLFPRSIVRTIKGAEKTGYVDEAMIRLSSFYEESIQRELKRITDLIEPALVIILGIIVAAIAISVVAPIYQMTGKIK